MRASTTSARAPRSATSARAIAGTRPTGSSTNGSPSNNSAFAAASPRPSLPASGCPPHARTHDAALARTSHLPYVIARALARVGGAAAKRRLAGPGFASATRLAASDPRMALAYVRANAANVHDAWRELRREVERELKALKKG